MVGGGDVAKTYDDLYYLERAAMVQILAMSTGRPLKPITAEMEAETVSQLSRDNRHRYALEHFAAIKRILDRIEPRLPRVNLPGAPSYPRPSPPPGAHSNSGSMFRAQQRPGPARGARHGDRRI